MKKQTMFALILALSLAFAAFAQTPQQPQAATEAAPAGGGILGQLKDPQQVKQLQQALSLLQ